jgi:hypothetical protein
LRFEKGNPLIGRGEFEDRFHVSKSVFAFETFMESATIVRITGRKMFRKGSRYERSSEGVERVVIDSGS